MDKLIDKGYARVAEDPVQKETPGIYPIMAYLTKRKAEDTRGIRLWSRVPR